MRRIPLHGKYALVDDEDYEIVSLFRWRVDHIGYILTQIVQSKSIEKNIYIYMHRLIANIPLHLFTDHKDLDKLNNQKYNLRQCNTQQNNCNVKIRKKRTAITSRFKGVYWDGSRKKWRAQIRINKILKNLGRYSCEEVAAKIYNDAAIKMHGEFACLNII